MAKPRGKLRRVNRPERPPAGQRGLDGSQGLAGRIGQQGVPGQLGAPGLDGPPGATGPRGLRGFRGLPGERGPAGIAEQLDRKEVEKWLFPLLASWDLPKPVKLFHVTTATYTVDRTALFAGENLFAVNYAGAVTITLPSIANMDTHAILTFKDMSGNAGTNNITLNVAA